MAATCAQSHCKKHQWPTIFLFLSIPESYKQVGGIGGTSADLGTRVRALYWPCDYLQLHGLVSIPGYCIQPLLLNMYLALKYVATVMYGQISTTSSGRSAMLLMADSIVECGRRTFWKAINVANQWGEHMIDFVTLKSAVHQQSICKHALMFSQGGFPVWGTSMQGCY
jgi:hypothetical protein